MLHVGRPWRERSREGEMASPRARHASVCVGGTMSGLALALDSVAVERSIIYYRTRQEGQTVARGDRGTPDLCHVTRKNEHRHPHTHATPKPRTSKTTLTISHNPSPRAPTRLSISPVPRLPLCHAWLAVTSSPPYQHTNTQCDTRCDTRRPDGHMMTSHFPPG